MQTVAHRARPAIVAVRTERGYSTGFVVDGVKGWVATSFHVVQQATKAEVVFASDRDGKPYSVDGFVKALPGKDLVVLHVRAGGKSLQALKLADKPPEPGDSVYAACGATCGLIGTILSGTATALVSGRELAALCDREEGTGSFDVLVGYDADCTWISDDAAVNHAWYGGPLLNTRGEVVGINALSAPGVQNMNFAISAGHLKKMLAAAGDAVKPLSALPPPAFAARAAGDPDKTLAAWKQYNRALAALTAERALANKTRDYRRLADALRAYAKEITKIDKTSVNRELVVWLADQSRDFNGLLYDLEEPTGEFGEDTLRIIAALEGTYDVTRVALGKRFQRDFPAVALGTTGETHADATSKAREPDEDRNDYRVWTSADAQYQVEAQLLGVTNAGKSVRLRRRRGGKEIDVPVERLSHADRKYIYSIVSPEGSLVVPPSGGQFAEPPAKAGTTSALPRRAHGKMADFRPAIAEVRAVGNKAGRGAGFVVDAARALVATNYHVIAQAERFSVVFPFDGDKKEYSADGVVALSPGNDLAIVHIQTGGKKLQALPLASTLPALDNAVVTIAGPSRIFLNGEVIGVWSDETVRELLGNSGDGCRRDALWIETTLMVAPADSGGPVLGEDGQVVGVNAWRPVKAEASKHLNFTIPATVLKTLLATAGTAVEPFPRARPCGGGDPQKTRRAWEALNRLADEFAERHNRAIERFEAVPLPDPQDPERGLASRNRQLKGVCSSLDDANRRLAAKLAEIELGGVDARLALLVFDRAEAARRAAADFAGRVLSIQPSDPGVYAAVRTRLANCDSALKTLPAEYEAVRTGLTRAYRLDFPAAKRPIPRVASP